MRTPEENIILFDSYIKGSLSQTEKSNFEEQLKNDSELAKEFEWYKLVVVGIQESRKAELKNYIKENAKINYWGNVWGRSWNIASAAIIVLALASYLVVQYYVKPNLEKKDQLAQNLDTLNIDDSLRNPHLANNGHLETLNEPISKNIETTQGNVSKNAPVLKEDLEKSIAQQIEIVEDENFEVTKDDVIPEATIAEEKVANTVKKEEGLSISSDVLLNTFSINILLIDEDESVKTDRPIKVNFWKSPVNFKGYSFNGKEINLFGVEDQKSVEIYTVSGEFILIKDALFYKIENTGGKYKPYKNLEKNTKAYDLIQSIKK